MSKLVKDLGTDVNENLVKELVGKFVNVPTNNHKVKDPIDGEIVVNAWFAGRVAGYEKAYVIFDYINQEMLDVPKEYFNILLCDGMAYILADDSEIHEISEEEFAEMVAEHEAKLTLEKVKPKILKPGSDF